MKKRGITVLLLLTAVFVGLICGFFIGRNFNHSEVEISRLPKPTEMPAASVVTSDTQPPSLPQHANGKVNINTATIEELQTLPDIGPLLAQRIIDYRQQHGPFTKPADLSKVEGIGIKTLEAILDHITTGG